MKKRLKKSKFHIFIHLFSMQHFFLSNICSAIAEQSDQKLKKSMFFHKFIFIITELSVFYKYKFVSLCSQVVLYFKWHLFGNFVALTEGKRCGGEGYWYPFGNIVALIAKSGGGGGNCLANLITLGTEPKSTRTVLWNASSI